jgi:hypothetical protein
MEASTSQHDTREPENRLLAARGDAEKPPAWELIESGRYRPRRIRGSLLGRELG